MIHGSIKVGKNELRMILYIDNSVRGVQIVLDVVLSQSVALREFQ